MFSLGESGEISTSLERSGTIVDIRLTNSKFINQKKFIFYNCTKILIYILKYDQIQLGIGNINQSSNSYKIY